jgi:copper chaperone NosL
MTTSLKKIIGPRVPEEIEASDRLRYRLPNIFFLMAVGLLIASVFLPYWKMTLQAPQYPKGLSVQAYIYKLTGDVREIDGLNHYIGMRPLAEAAQLERSLSIFAVTVLSLLTIAAIFIHTKYTVLLALPAILYPFIFLGDMYFWLRNFGLNLDPAAPLSSAIKPFIPPLLGTGKLAQFVTITQVQSGFYLAVLASVCIIIGLYFHRKAYKPLVDSDMKSEDQPDVEIDQE